MNSIEIRKNLRDKIFLHIQEVFNQTNSLAESYTLADLDYFDSNYHYPEEGVSWMDAVGLNCEDAVRNKTDEIISMNLIQQIKNKKILNKNYHWSEVDSIYMETYYCGLSYMNPQEFQFYLAAWIYKYLMDEFRHNSLVNFYFLSLFSNATIKFVLSDDVRWLSLNAAQIELIKKFFVYIMMSEKNLDDVGFAKNCMLSGLLNVDGESNDLFNLL